MELFDRIFEANMLKVPPNLVGFVSNPDRFLKVYGKENLEKRYKPQYQKATKSFEEIPYLQRASIASLIVTVESDRLTQELVDKEIDDLNRMFTDIRNIMCRDIIELALANNPNKDKLIPEYHRIAKERGLFID